MNAVLNSIDTGLALSAPHVTVYFAKDGEKLDFVTNEGRWTKYERAQVMEALETWGAVADLTFAVTRDAEDATFKEAWDSYSSFRENYKIWKDLGYL